MELGLILAISGGALAVIGGIGSVLGVAGRTSCSGSCSRGSR